MIRLNVFANNTRALLITLAAILIVGAQAFARDDVRKPIQPARLSETTSSDPVLAARHELIRTELRKQITGEHAINLSVLKSLARVGYGQVNCAECYNEAFAEGHDVYMDCMAAVENHDFCLWAGGQAACAYGNSWCGASACEWQFILVNAGYCN